MHLTIGKSASNPRYKPGAQTGRKLNPIFARILKIHERIGLPTHYKRDLVIDRMAISRKHPSAVIWGVRETGTELICLSRGVRKSAPKGAHLFGGTRGEQWPSWYKHARDKIEFWSGEYGNKMKWYYITPSGEKRVSPEEAIKLLGKYAGKWTGY